MNYHQVCKSCGSAETNENYGNDNLCCRKCGSLNEELFITTSLDFTEKNGSSHLSGQFVRMTDVYAKQGNNIIRTTNFQIQDKIRGICLPLGLSEGIMTRAYRWYKLSLQGNLTKGRNILYTLSACVYIVCRQEKTPHLLNDFSELLDLNVFKIGNIFMKIVVFLNIKIPLIDPSLFIHRFFSKLKLVNPKIIFFSMRLISRMKRDWIIVGRRPNNLCGAALVTASRIYHEERTVEEVAKVVRASAHTINIRLKEISETQTANLTITDFLNIWLENEEDPPITKKNMKMLDDKTIESGIFTPPSETESNFSQDADVINDLSQTNEIDEIINFDDVDCFILTREEAKQKEKVWNSMYEEFLREQSIRASVRKKERKKRKPKEKYDSVEDAVKGLIKDRKMSNKINYDILEKIFKQ